jgi:hypothetical protein
MPKETRNPFPSLALAGLLAGALGQTNWFVLYAGLLFGFATVIGFKRPPQMMRWILVLAVGTPVAHFASAMLGWSASGEPWAADLLARTGGALVAILPGLGAGLICRRLSSKMRKAPA